MLTICRVVTRTPLALSGGALAAPYSQVQVDLASPFNRRLVDLGQLVVEQEVVYDDMLVGDLRDLLTDQGVETVADGTPVARARKKDLIEALVARPANTEEES
jgi:hypothetical protein